MPFEEPLTPQQFVDNFISQYHEKVVPLIESGDYEQAYVVVSIARHGVEQFGDLRRIIDDVKPGLNFMSSVKILEEALESQNLEKIRTSQDMFRVFSKQTQLPAN